VIMPQFGMQAIRCYGCESAFQRVFDQPPWLPDEPEMFHGNLHSERPNRGIPDLTEGVNDRHNGD
jgi:hypothetical protein